MLAEHVGHGADLTVACLEVPLGDASDFGVMAIDADDRIVTLPLFSALHRLPIMRTSCLAAGPRSSFAQTSSG